MVCLFFLGLRVFPGYFGSDEVIRCDIRCLGGRLDILDTEEKNEEEGIESLCIYTGI